MHVVTLGVLVAAMTAMAFLWLKYRKENMGGYGTISGLYYNNNAKHCFKNIYDPPDFPGYCETIGTVVI